MKEEYVKLFDTTSFWKEHRVEIAEGAERIFRHGEFIQGQEVRELEKELCTFTGSEYCITCGSGTDALYLALRACNIGAGDGVITTAFTFIATAEAIKRTGAYVYFADINPGDWNISADAICKIMKDKWIHNVKAIIVVNIFGMPAEYNVIKSIAMHYDIKIIEDAAQSFGAIYNGKTACNIGDIGCTSFFPTKPLGGIGDGGAVFTNNAEEAEIIRSIANHGMSETKYNTVRSGINSRLDTLNAAALRIKLREYPKILQKRKTIRGYMVRMIKKGTQVGEDKETTGESAIYTIPILCWNRKRMIEQIKNKIPYGIYYKKPIPMQPVFKNLGHREGDFPVAEFICGKIINLPCHEYLRDKDVEQIIESVNE